MKALVLFVTLCVSCFAQHPRQVDPAKSKITIKAYKAGLFAFAGHDHLIEVQISSGTIDEGSKAVEINVRAEDMKVIDPEESDKDRAEIRETMLSNKLLDAARYPAITFRSHRFTQLSPDSSEIEGELGLHGVVRPVKVIVKRIGPRYVGSTKLKQSDYGMKPVSVAGGSVKVKDEVKIDFIVETRNE